MTRWFRLLPVFALALQACAGDGSASTRGSNGDSAARVSESRPASQVTPQEVALRHFQSPIEPVKALAGGQPSLEALAREVVRAIASSDTAALQRAWVNRAEWAYLYFPTSIYMRPPYEMPPEVQWELSLAASEKGVLRLLRRLGGRPLHVEAVECEPVAAGAQGQGAAALWRECRVRYRVAGAAPETRVLFQAALALGGAFKVLSYANEF